MLNRGPFCGSVSEQVPTKCVNTKLSTHYRLVVVNFCITLTDIFTEFRTIAGCAVTTRARTIKSSR